MATTFHTALENLRTTRRVEVGVPARPGDYQPDEKRSGVR